MSARQPKAAASFGPAMIAPCGMNCGVCFAHLRQQNRCPGCNGDDAGKPKTRVACRIKQCDERSGQRKFCFECDQFPCARLRQLDKRYRSKYGMSMIENLESLRELGLREFVAREKARWTCPDCGGVVCVHKTNCIDCGRARG
jgi:hypothetical protein